MGGTYTRREDIWLKGSAVLSLKELKENWPNWNRGWTGMGDGCRGTMKSKTGEVG